MHSEQSSGDPTPSAIHDDTQTHATLEELKQRLAFTEAFLDTVYDKVPYIVFVYDVMDDGQFRSVRMNQTGSKLTGRPVSFWPGKTPDEIHAPEKAAAVLRRLRECIATGQPITDEEEVIFPNGVLWTQSIYAPVRDETGRVVRVVGTAIDVTARKLRESEEITERENIIVMQSNTLTELSTPLLSITDDVLVMPLIGTIDTQRAQQIIDTLLNGVAASSAKVAILDITGVSVVDTQIANILLRAAYAVELLGAKVILSGIRPEIAQTMVGLGINLHAVTTRSTLQAAIAFALHRAS